MSEKPVTLAQFRNHLAMICLLHEQIGNATYLLYTMLEEPETDYDIANLHRDMGKLEKDLDDYTVHLITRMNISYPGWMANDLLPDDRDRVKHLLPPEREGQHEDGKPSAN